MGAVVLSKFDKGRVFYTKFSCFFTCFFSFKFIFYIHIHIYPYIYVSLYINFFFFVPCERAVFKPSFSGIWFWSCIEDYNKKCVWFLNSVLRSAGNLWISYSLLLSVTASLVTLHLCSFQFLWFALMEFNASVKVLVFIPNFLVSSSFRMDPLAPPCVCSLNCHSQGS